MMKTQTARVATVLGANLHSLRRQRDLTLDGLARLSGVSRAMLWQIERARSAPTITVLSRVADALGVSVSTFLEDALPAPGVVLRKADAQPSLTEAGAVATRALFPVTGSRYTEFYELGLQVGACEQLAGRRPGTYENIVVSTGLVQVELGAATHLLESGDAMYFRADRTHGYRNVGPVPALLYRVVLYPTAIGQQSL